MVRLSAALKGCVGAGRVAPDKLVDCAGMCSYSPAGKFLLDLGEQDSYNKTVASPAAAALPLPGLRGLVFRARLWFRRFGCFSRF